MTALSVVLLVATLEAVVDIVVDCPPAVVVDDACCWLEEGEDDFDVFDWVLFTVDEAGVEEEVAEDVLEGELAAFVAELDALGVPDEDCC